MCLSNENNNCRVYFDENEQRTLYTYFFREIQQKLMHFVHSEKIPKKCEH